MESRQNGPVQELQRLKSYENLTPWSLVPQIKQMINKFGVDEAKTRNVPIPGRTVPSSDAEGSPALSDDESRLYRSIIGSLMYAYIGSRPGIGYVTKELCCQFQSPTRSGPTHAKHVLRYLKETQNLKLIYKQSNELEINNATNVRILN